MMAHEDPEPELAEATESLYGLDLSDFVAARHELVRSLRKLGKRELATQVALRRPTLATWAVNQLARQRRDELDGVLQLGEALRQAQTQTLAGGEAAELRQAGRTRREAVARLADLADASAHHGESSPPWTPLRSIPAPPPWWRAVV